MENDLKKFTEDFFKNLKCSVRLDNSLLHVDKVPQEFENLFGKKSPYIISFDQSHLNAEIVSKGSFMLKAMNSYLENRAKTSIIKLDFERDYKIEFQHYLKLKNSEIFRIDKKVKFKPIIRFTFSTNFQYLNEREQLINDLILEELKIIYFNLEKYKYSEGKESDLSEIDLKSPYAIAKEELKNILKNRILETKELLNKKLEKETYRIKEHYSQQRQEIAQNLKKLEEQKRTLQIEMKKSINKEIQEKIYQIDQNIVLLKDPQKEKQLSIEEQFFINDETHKLSLNIDNKLLNTTIIYYPIFNFSIFLKNADAGRQIEIMFNPMQDSITPIKCETCDRVINEILLCSSGHILCNNCYTGCSECGRGLCKKCIKKECEICSRRLCKRCAKSCSSCLKPICKSHSKTDFITGKDACVNCLKPCSVCNQFTNQRNLKSNLGRLVCQKCLRLSILKKK